jgi:hypothetical protein
VLSGLAVALCLGFGGQAAQAQYTRHLIWSPASNPAPSQRRDWVQQGPNAWVETSADGRTTRLRVLEAQTALHGVKGQTVIEPGRMKAFIPDAGVTGPYAQVLYFIDLAGDSQEWQVLGIFQEKR